MLLVWPSFHSVFYVNHRLVRVRVKFDKLKVRMADDWKLTHYYLVSEFFMTNCY